MIISALAAVTLALLGACGGSGDSSASATATAGGSGTPQPSGETPTPVGSAAVDYCAPAPSNVGLVSQVEFSGGTGLYNAGEQVGITLVLENCAANNSILYYPTTQRYDFSILNSAGTEIWRSTDGKQYAQTEGTEVLQTKQTLKYTETWDQKGRDGQQVPNGLYKVSALSVGCNQQATTNCAEFGPIGFIQIGPLPSATATASH